MMKPGAFEELTQDRLEYEIIPKLMENKKKLDVFYM
jgi:hypothetical protein